MNTLFNNMLPFEIILLIMGLVVFLVLLFLLIWNIMKQRPVKSLLPFFLFPILMVGYPSVKKIQIGNFLLDLNHYVEIVNANPKDSVARENLKSGLSKIKSGDRFLNSAKALLTIGKAETALGKYDSASLYLDKAAKLDPASEEVQLLKQDLHAKIQIQNIFSQNVQKLNEQIEQLKQSPNSQALNNIANILSALKVPEYVQPEQMITLAKSYAIAGNKDQSIEILNTLNNTENNTESSTQEKTVLLKDSIREGLYQQKFPKSTLNENVATRSFMINKAVLNKVVIMNK